MPPQLHLTLHPHRSKPQKPLLTASQACRKSNKAYRPRRTSALRLIPPSAAPPPPYPFFNRLAGRRMPRFAPDAAPNQAGHKPARSRHPSSSSSNRHPPSPTRVSPLPGALTTYKQRHTGLYGGLSIQHGHHATHPTNALKNPTYAPRTFEPNVQRKQLYSEALGRRVRVKVSTRVLRTVDKVGGLDNYLVGRRGLGGVRELGLEGWRLRWAVLVARGDGRTRAVGVGEDRSGEGSGESWEEPGGEVRGSKEEEEQEVERGEVGDMWEGKGPMEEMPQPLLPAEPVRSPGLMSRARTWAAMKYHRFRG